MKVILLITICLSFMSLNNVKASLLVQNTSWEALRKENSKQLDQVGWIGLVGQNLRRKIKIAVIDTGLNIHQPEFEDYLSKNKGEFGVDDEGLDKRFNNKDDDNNGYVDDFIGWSSFHNSNKILDKHGHGTHIASLIMQLCDPREIEIVPVQFFDVSNRKVNTVSATVKAIHYAIQREVDIINFSAGGYEFSRDEFEALKLANSKGILLIAAAGNENVNTDELKYYPASYSLSNIISVGSVDFENQKVKSSNFGQKTIYISAPGFNLFSFLNLNRIGAMTGTSQATAVVTAIVAKWLAYQDSSLVKNPEWVRRVIEETSSYESNLKHINKLSSVIHFSKMIFSKNTFENPIGFEVQNFMNLNSTEFLVSINN